MLLFVLAYLGGVFTILSPCILPVLPFVFARSNRPFVTNGLPLLAGMAITFAAVATLAAVGGGWAVHANQIGRIAALVLLGCFGITLLVPSLATRLMQPLVAFGSRMSVAAQTDGPKGSPVLSSLLLGVATGFLWAPCAGPILGLLLTGAALNGANVATSLLLLAYAAGAATSLAAALLLGSRVSAAMKRSLGAGEWVRRALGVAVLAAVALIAFGVDTSVLASASLASTSKLEQSLIDRIRPNGAPATAVVASSNALPVEGTMPSINRAVEWLNSPPLTNAGLRGKVVLVDFWTYSCINCLRSIPYVRTWVQRYGDEGFVVIGVHAPEFAFERDIPNVRRATKELQITYPVAIDNNYAIWRAFSNEYWPADYLVDVKGRVRYHHFGEGDDDVTEAAIRQLLTEAGKTGFSAPIAPVRAAGAEMASDELDVQSNETYIGYARASNFTSPGGQAHDRVHTYRAPAALKPNQWALKGAWTVTKEHAELQDASGRIVFRFHARDLHLVLAPGPTGKPVPFKVTIDGRAPGADHGVDTDSAGRGIVTEQRLYQLVRQQGHIRDRTFDIEFTGPQVEAFAFTFG